jgi:hypothetical protein
VKKALLNAENKFSPVVLAAVAGGLFLVGVIAVMLIRAAGTRLYLMPSSANVNVNATFQVAVRVDTPDQINAVQANIAYPADKLELTGVDYAGTAFGVQAEETRTAGLVKLGRGTNAGSGSVTGDLLVATLTFKALVAGTGDLVFAAGSAVAKDDGLGTNVLGTTEGSTITINSPSGGGTASLTVTPAAATLAQGSNVRLEIWTDSGSEPVNAVQANLSYPAALLELSSIDYTGTAYAVQAEETKAAGSVRIARGVAGGAPPVTGAGLVAVLNFRALGSSGSANVDFTSGSAVVHATTNANILTTMTGGAYTLTAAPDTILPTVTITSPANNTAVTGNVNVVATASDNVGVTKVELWVDGALVGTDTSAPYSITWPSSGAGNHTLEMRAYDAAGNVGMSSITVSVSDVQAPSVPANLRKTSATQNSITLAWDASTDNVGVAGYQILRNNVAVASPTGTAYTDGGLTPGTSYNYTVQARDAAGNLSAVSPALVASTMNKAGDVDGNGRVDVYDLSRLLTRWRTTDTSADFNGDNTVDVFDLNLLLSNWEG